MQDIEDAIIGQRTDDSWKVAWDDVNGEELEILTHVIEQTFNARIGVVLDCWLEIEKVRSGVGSLLVCVLFFWATLFSSS